ncbi:hypothetical protein LINGRAHAP2_LOCUS21365 [Linum grandiflorum]
MGEDSVSTTSTKTTDLDQSSFTFTATNQPPPPTSASAVAASSLLQSLQRQARTPPSEFPLRIPPPYTSKNPPIHLTGRRRCLLPSAVTAAASPHAAVGVFLSRFHLPPRRSSSLLPPFLNRHSARASPHSCTLSSELLLA